VPLRGAVGTKGGGRWGNSLGLNRTGHMSFLTGQDRTPKFAGQVLPDRTESGPAFLNILPANSHKIRSLDIDLVSKVNKKKS
jgi:hypothetical protein